MYVRCRRCGHDWFLVWLPSPVFVWAPAAYLGAFLSWLLVQQVWPAIGWWSAPLAVPLAAVLFTAIACGLLAVAFALAHAMRCSNCGNRRWSWPFSARGDR